MAGNGSGRGGTGRGSGGKAGTTKPMGYQPTLTDRKLIKSIATTQRRLAYLRKEGLTPDEPQFIKNRQRLSDLVKQSMRTVRGMAGLRVSLRSRSAAAANQRYRRDAVLASGQTTPKYSAYKSGTPYGRATRVSGSAPRFGRLSGTTRGQGNLLTGGFGDVVRGRSLRPGGGGGGRTGLQRAEARRRRGMATMGL